tara:strand:- start:157 stop:363 length:207 start_codon:yes stop_codon:yes gene_type:complete
MSRFALGTAIGGSMGGGGIYGGTICDSTDPTFYCKMVRFTSELRMLLFILLIIFVPIYYLKVYFSNKK